MGVIKKLSFIILFIQPAGVFAQPDPSSTAFIGASGSKAPIESGYSPGRYKIHDKTPAREQFNEVRRREISGQFERTQSKPERDSSASVLEKTTTNSTADKIQNSAGDVKKPSALPHPKMNNSNKPVSTPSSSQGPQTPAQQNKSSEVTNRSELTESTTQEGAGADDTPQDNYLSLSAGMTYQQIKSESPSYARRFDLKTPAVFFKGEIWLMPEWGVTFDYSRNYAGTLEDNPVSGKAVNITYQSLGLDASWRTPWKASYMGHVRYEVSLGVFDQNLMPEGSAQERVNIRTNGIRVTFNRHVKIHDFTSRLYFRVAPFNSQAEDGLSGQYKSGELNVSTQMTVGFMAGSNISEHWSYFIHPSVTYESSTYKGLTSLDPVASKTFENISVNSTLTQISLGFTWGQ